MDDTLAQRIGALLPRLTRFALGLSGSPSEADDLVQAACVKALTTAATPQSGGRVDSWMYRIIQNQWIDTCRARASRGPHFAVSEVAEWEFAAADTTAQLEARFALAQVRRVVRGLPKAQRTVLVMTCVEGLTYRECAARLNLPEGTVMSRLARARENLHRRLAVTA